MLFVFEQGKRKWFVVAYSIIITLLIVGGIWYSSTRIAVQKTQKLLHSSIDYFIDEQDMSTDIWMEAFCLSIVRLLETAKHLSPEEFAKLTQIYPVGKILIADKDGLVLNATDSELEGLSLYDFPQARKFMECITKKKSFMSQPFRESVFNPTQICKYVAYSFLDGSGLIELGCSIEAFNKKVENSYQSWIAHCTFGVYGFFVLVENNLNPLQDASLSTIAQELRKIPDAKENELFVCKLPEKGKCYCLPFDYSAYRLVAVVPSKEYFLQRNLFISRASLYLLFFAVPLTLMLIRVLDLLEKNRQRAEREKEERLRDMNRARIIQTSFLTQAKNFMNEALNFRIFADLIPAKVVGGDTYCFFLFDNTRLGLFVADVSGKGIPAAIFVMYFRGLLRNYILSGNHDLVEAVTRTNEHICQHNEAEMFVTCWTGILNLSNGILEYVNAGHNYPYIRHADGSLEMINKRGGLFLGMFPEATYKLNDLQLKPGDRLFLYTDGVTEAMNEKNQLYGKKKLEKTLTQTTGILYEQVIRDVKQFSGATPQSDDITVMEFAWYGEPERVSSSFKAKEDSLEKAMEFLQKNLANLEKTPRMRLLNAADECISNIVNYSHASIFSIIIETSPDRCRLILEDDGTPYNPLTHTDPQVHIPIEERPVGGLGILISKKLMDKVSYSFTDSKNCLSLLIFRMANG